MDRPAFGDVCCGGHVNPFALLRRRRPTLYDGQTNATAK
jgi:hypothetical protein